MHRVGKLPDFRINALTFPIESGDLQVELTFSREGWMVCYKCPSHRYFRDSQTHSLGNKTWSTFCLADHKDSFKWAFYKPEHSTFSITLYIYMFFLARWNSASIARIVITTVLQTYYILQYLTEAYPNKEQTFS